MRKKFSQWSLAFMNASDGIVMPIALIIMLPSLSSDCV
jgi:hypothetical protein